MSGVKRRTDKHVSIFGISLSALFYCHIAMKAKSKSTSDISTMADVGVGSDTGKTSRLIRETKYEDYS